MSQVVEMSKDFKHRACHICSDIKLVQIVDDVTSPKISNKNVKEHAGQANNTVDTVPCMHACGFLRVREF